MASFSHFVILLLICSVSLKVRVVEGQAIKICNEKLAYYRSMADCEGVCNEGCHIRRRTAPRVDGSCLQDGPASVYCLCNWICG
ncbi:hypothetical protein M5689_015392 [Euphorbia peplus]|nr:hypothetical protein M5689_015392 [Euphorbia peplus]